MMDTFATLWEGAGRVFDDETPSEFHGRVQTGGRCAVAALMQIADELGIQPSMLRKWSGDAAGDPAVGDPHLGAS
jgi:hypothetical protein